MYCHFSLIVYLQYKKPMLNDKLNNNGEIDIYLRSEYCLFLGGIGITPGIVQVNCL